MNEYKHEDFNEELTLYKCPDDEKAYALVNMSEKNGIAVKIGGFAYVGGLFELGFKWLQEGKEPLVIEVDK